MKRKNSFRNNTSRQLMDTVLPQKCRIYFLIVHQVSSQYVIKYAVVIIIKRQLLLTRGLFFCLGLQASAY